MIVYGYSKSEEMIRRTSAVYLRRLPSPIFSGSLSVCESTLLPRETSEGVSLSLRSHSPRSRNREPSLHPKGRTCHPQEDDFLARFLQEPRSEEDGPQECRFPESIFLKSRPARNGCNWINPYSVLNRNSLINIGFKFDVIDTV